MTEVGRKAETLVPVKYHSFMTNVQRDLVDSKSGFQLFSLLILLETLH